METDDQDEAYHSGLAMMSGSEQFKEDRQQSDSAAYDASGTKAPGSHPVAGTPPKERSAMNRLFTGNQPASSSTKDIGGSIKPGLGLVDSTPSAVTPTTHLTGKLKDFTLRQKGIGEKAALDSPTSEYVSSGDYPSLCESDLGYTSMPSMDKPDESLGQTSLSAERPQLITNEGNQGEDMEVDRAVSKPGDQNVTSMDPKEAQKINIGDVSLLVPEQAVKNSELAAMSETSSVSSHESRSLSPAPVSMLITTSSRRSESPTVIPQIGEDIEISTEGTAALQRSPEQRRRLRKEGVASKRSAAGLPEPDLGPSTKNPRLSPEITMAAKRPIRVSTIVSPSLDHLSPQATKQRGHSPVTITVGDHSASPSPSHSPRPSPNTSTHADTSLIERVFHSANIVPLHIPGTTGLTFKPQLFQFVTQQQQQQQQQQRKQQTPSKPRVDFTDIQAMSKSDRPSVTRTQLITDNTPQPMVEGSEPATTLGVRQTLERPGPSGSPIPVTSPMHVVNLISPHSSRQASSSPARSRSLSPHSPRVDKASPRARGDQQPEEGAKKGSLHSSENIPVEKQNALLKVTEAHLAVLPDEDGDTPLHLAIIHENIQLTRYIIRLVKGVDAHINLDMPNNMRQTPLHLAVITKQSEMVQMLLEHGVSINYPDRKGNSAIHLAAARKEMKILQILSKAKSPHPDFNGKNFAGLTAVHVATKEANIDVLKFLFQMGANKNAMDSCSGRTPLHYAVEAENFILVNFLLESSCNVNAPTFAGNTPLHIAAGRRLKEIVALLMAYGANPALANGEGDFPSDLPASLLMQRAKLNAH